MEKKLFDFLDESVREKLRNCRSEAEMRQVIADAGLQELSLDMLERRVRRSIDSMHSVLQGPHGLSMRNRTRHAAGIITDNGG